MLQHHIDSYRKALYETEFVIPVTGYVHHNAPGLYLVNWKDSWEPGDTVRQMHYLEGDVLFIERRALSGATKRLWAEPKDASIPNIDRQTFKGTTPCTASNPFNMEPFLRKYVKIGTGDTMDPDLDIAPSGRFAIQADPRPPSSLQDNAVDGTTAPLPPVRGVQARWQSCRHDHRG